MPLRKTLPPKNLSAGQVAELAGCHTNTVNRAAQDGKFPGATRFNGRNWAIPQSPALRSWVAGRRKAGRRTYSYGSKGQSPEGGEKSASPKAGLPGVNIVTLAKQLENALLNVARDGGKSGFRGIDYERLQDLKAALGSVRGVLDDLFDAD